MLPIWNGGPIGARRKACFQQLVRRLIFATGWQGLRRVSFRSGEGVQLSGWDGVVEADEGTPFVPADVSGWELGTNRNVGRKAQEDYRKRTEDLKGLDLDRTTFVFVTLRRWANKREWEQDRRREGIWRDVRVYDADDLETWLEQAPAVHVWLSIRLGKRPADVLDLETYWEDLRHTTHPPLSPDLVLGGRKEVITQIHKWLYAEPTPLPLQAESREEAIAIFAAALHSLPEEERTSLLSRTVVVRSEQALRVLAAQLCPLIFVVDFEVDALAVAGATRQKHHALVPVGREVSPTDRTTIVPRLSVHAAAKVLADLGLPDNDARRLAMLARRSFQAFRRKIASCPELHQPVWAQPAEAEKPALVAAMLAGAWKETVEGDREAVARLASSDYEKVRDVLTRWAHTSDPPVRCIGGMWYVVSREDAWSLLARYLQPDDLKRLEEVVLFVLGSPDPRFDLPERERYMAGVMGKVPRYSAGLCRGLAETLAVMATSQEVKSVADGRSPSRMAALIVRKLFERANADWRVWASLSEWGVLPVLAEAVPDEFLQAVEDGLRGDDPLLLRLFAKDDGGPFTSSPHTGLLWALETVAWSPEHLGYASRLLAKLARLDPGGRLANRPQNSLRSIFLPWLPQTAASAEQRLRVLDGLRAEEPQIAWKLMVQLLTGMQGVGLSTAAPRWREWRSEAERRVSQAEYYQMTCELLARLVQDAAQDGHRWKDLVEALPDLPPDLRRSVVEGLEGLDARALREDDRSVIWHALRVLLSRHRSYPHARWALPSDVLDRLDALMRRFEPASPLTRFGWLFGRCPNLPEGEKTDWRAQQEEVARSRVEAVRNVYAQGGFAKVLSLAEGVECPDTVGFAFAQTEEGKCSEDQVLSTYLAADVSAHARFAWGFASGRISVEGREWAEARVSLVGTKWRPEQQAEFLTCLPADARTWGLVSSLGPDTERSYWQRINPLVISEADAEQAVRCFLEYGRPAAAVSVLAHCEKVSASLVADTLEALVESPPEPEEMDSLVIVELIHRLQGSPDVERSRLARLEWAFLPLFGPHGFQPRVLHEELARSPELFVEAIRFVFLAEGEEPVELSEQDVARARWARELLESWRTIPGDRGDGSVDGEALRAWVERARALLQASGHGRVGDYMIGQLLSGSPPGPDGAWPHPAVRDLIEQISSADLEQGIEHGRYNSRGVVTKSLYEGGHQERQIAEDYERDAQTVADRWPRTAAMLRRMAALYREEAAREDREAELRQDLGF
jgi:hypothetical protein